MIAAAHVMAGLISGMAVLSPRAGAARAPRAFGLGILSHVVLDAVPHSDYGSLAPGTVLVIVTFEVVASLTIAWYILRSQRFPGPRLPLLAGLAGSMLPDAKFMVTWLPEPARSLVFNVGDRFHAPFHADPTPIAVGLTLEIAMVLLLMGGFWLMVRRLTPDRART